MEIEGLRSAEKRALMIKITRYLKDKINNLVKKEGWRFKEITQATSIPQNRLTGISRYEEGYDRPITETLLVLAIGGKLVKTAELLKKIPALNQAEKNYLQSMIIYEDEGTKEALLKLKEQNVDTATGLNLFLALKNAGIDPIEELQKIAKRKI